MTLESWAALLAIIDFGGKLWRYIWKKYNAPIKQFLCSCIDSIISFLTKIKRHLDTADDNDNPILYSVMVCTV